MTWKPYKRKTFKIEELRALDPILAEKVQATYLGSLAASVEPISLEDLERARLLVSGEFTITTTGMARGAEVQHVRAALSRVVRKYFNESAAARRKFLEYVTRLQGGVSAPSANPDDPTVIVPPPPATFLACPECGRADFKTNSALGIHRSRTHGIHGPAYERGKRHEAKIKRSGRKPVRKENHAKAS
jgi:uncharacterized C2H2 Zn-finger protein